MGDDLLKHHIAETERRFDRLENKLDRVLAGYWMAIGGSIVISAIIGMLFR